MKAIFLSQRSCGAQHHSDGNNAIQSGAACSPDSVLESETFALLFGFLHTEAALEQNVEGRHDSTASPVSLFSASQSREVVGSRVTEYKHR